MVVWPSRTWVMLCMKVVPPSGTTSIPNSQPFFRGDKVKAPPAGGNWLDYKRKPKTSSIWTRPTPAATKVTAKAANKKSPRSRFRPKSKRGKKRRKKRRGGLQTASTLKKQAGESSTRLVKKSGRIGNASRRKSRKLRKSRPAALRATSIVPDGPPSPPHFQGYQYRIARSWGPERIETGWWRGRTVGRDYYRVETAAGRRFWLFRRLRDDRWFLHGAFD